MVLERCGVGMGGLVFGTLLGPEATGPWHWRGFPLRGESFVGGVGLVCFWFPGCIDHTVGPFAGARVGCVVRGCCLRTT